MLKPSILLRHQYINGRVYSLLIDATLPVRPCAHPANWSYRICEPHYFFIIFKKKNDRLLSLTELLNEHQSIGMQHFQIHPLMRVA
jgi:hypothetical protein